MKEDKRVCHFEVEKCEDCKFFYIYPNAFTTRGYTLLCRNPDRPEDKWGNGQIMGADRKYFPKYCPLPKKSNIPEQWLPSASNQEDSIN